MASRAQQQQQRHHDDDDIPLEDDDNLSASGAAPPAAPPLDLRDWASPEQLFEMRRISDQVRHHLQAENHELRLHLSQTVKERDGLSAELAQATRQLEAARAQRAEVDRVKARHAEWSEERATLVLRLQQLSNEVARLRGGSTGGGGGAAAPGASSNVSASTPSTAFRGSGGGASQGSHMAHPHGGGSGSGSSSTGGTASATAFLLPVHAALVEELRSEVIAGIEAQARLALQLAEADRRAEFQSVLHNMESRRGELRGGAIAAELVRVQQALRDARDNAASERGARLAAESQISQLTSKLHAATLERQLSTEAEEADASAEIERLSDHVSELKARLAAAESAAASARAAHHAEIAALQREQIDAMQRLDAQRAAADADAERRIAHLEDELHELRRENVATVTRLHDEAAHARQEAAVALAEVERLRRGCKEYATSVAQLTVRGEEAAAAKNSISVEAERAVADYHRLRAQHEALLAEVAQLTNVKADRDLLARHLAAAQEELRATTAAVERTMREAETAAEILQRHAAADTAAAVAAAEKTTEMAAKETVRRRRAEAERNVLRDKLNAYLATELATSLSQQQQQQDGGGVNKASDGETREEITTAAVLRPPPPRRVDVLELLRENAEAAAALQRSINGGKLPPAPQRR